MTTQSNLKLTNRITNKGGNWGRLTLTFKHLDSTHKAGWRWKFYHNFNVKDTNQTRNYIKSSDFQERPEIGIIFIINTSVLCFTILLHIVTDRMWMKIISH